MTTSKVMATILLLVTHIGSYNVMAQENDAVSAARASLAALKCEGTPQGGSAPAPAGLRGGSTPPEASLGCNPSAANCGTANADYSYPIPVDSKNCEESSSNNQCPRCVLWTEYAVSDKACKNQKQTWCSRQPYVTVIKVPGAGQQYLALPNEAVTGIESWQRLSGAERYWGDVWDAAKYVITNSPTKPTWTLGTLAIALNPSAHRDMHQMHFHMDALKPYYQGVLDSSKPPSGLKAWPTSWVTIDPGKSALFVPTTSQTPETAAPFAAWNAEYPNTKPVSGIHQVGLLVTKDKADKGWFLVAVQGAADNMIG